jgi:hypothetical protein
MYWYRTCEFHTRRVCLLNNKPVSHSARGLPLRISRIAQHYARTSTWTPSRPVHFGAGGCCAPASTRVVLPSWAAGLVAALHTAVRTTYPAATGHRRNFLPTLQRSSISRSQRPKGQARHSAHFEFRGVLGVRALRTVRRRKVAFNTSVSVSNRKRC